MTTEFARDYLISHIPSITYDIEQYFLTHERPFGIAGSQDVDGRLLVFQRYNDHKLTKFIASIKIPESIEENALIAHALRSYIKGIYPYAVLESQSMYWKQIRREVSLEVYNECHEELSDEGESMESKVEIEVLKEEIQKAQQMLTRMLQPQERVVWELRGVNASIEYACSVLYPDSKIDKKTTDKIRYRFRLLEYRFACLVAARDILSDRIALGGLNRYPTQCKKYFGVKKLESLPYKADLLKAARGDEAEGFVELPKQTWVPVSKVDFNGKKHDHPVVYQSSTGGYYDHVTKQTRESATI